jgi:hypothetical protein
MGLAVGVNVFVAGSKTSALVNVVVFDVPPVISTLPEARRVAVWAVRAVLIEAASNENLFVDGSNSSALESTVEPSMPPATRTRPLLRRVTVN